MKNGPIKGGMKACLKRVLGIKGSVLDEVVELLEKEGINDATFCGANLKRAEFHVHCILSLKKRR